MSMAQVMVEIGAGAENTAIAAGGRLSAMASRATVGSTPSRSFSRTQARYSGGPPDIGRDVPAWRMSNFWKNPCGPSRGGMKASQASGAGAVGATVLSWLTWLGLGAP